MVFNNLKEEIINLIVITSTVIVEMKPKKANKKFLGLSPAVNIKVNEPDPKAKKTI
jgi:hypothetical protein